MLDTVRFKLNASPLKPIVSSDWEVDRGSRIDDEGQYFWTRYQHKESDLRIFANDGLASKIEVSLPKLFSGSNGRLLRPGEVNTAYFAMVDLIGSVVEESLPEKLLRADLVHHFYGYAFEFIDALNGLKHTGVRNKSKVYFNSGIDWPGKELYIRLYDKKAEQCKVLGCIQRLEAQLRGKKLEDIVWSQSSGFDVEQLYALYKKICGGFSRRILPKLGSLAELLVWLRENKVKINDTCPVDRFLGYKSERQRYRIQKALNSVSLDYFDASFLKYLPDDMSELVFLDCLEEEQTSATAGPARGCGALVA